jgi:hypothetical protein
MEEQIELLRIEFEKEYGMYWWINKTGTAERSLPYQEWLEKKAIQVQAKVIVKLVEEIDKMILEETGNGNKAFMLPAYNVLTSLKKKIIDNKFSE